MPRIVPLPNTRMTSQLAENALPDGRRVITATGELDQIELPPLRLSIQNAFADGAREVIVDMSAVTYMDSSVLAALIAESIEAENRSVRLTVVTGTSGIMRSLELKGLIQVMHIVETLDQALG
jgi:anti-sigma B factor antagonist